MTAQELVGRDNTVQINVIRKEGFIGHVIVKWIATGDHDGNNDITPLEGRVSQNRVNPLLHDNSF